VARQPVGNVSTGFPLKGEYRKPRLPGGAPFATDRRRYELGHRPATCKAARRVRRYRQPGRPRRRAAGGCRMTWLNLVGVPFLIRLSLVVLFPFSALDKLMDWRGALKQANSSFLPGGAILLVLAMIVEIIAPFMILFGWHDRLAAFLLAGFCAVTALLYHEFWRYGDFWAKGDSVARAHFWDFLKNFGLIGGLMLLVFLSGLSPVEQIAAHPLSSAPYGMTAPPP
jgi:putative oxidoreductase